MTKSVALVQTHALNWNGTPDASLRMMEGRPIIAWCLESIAQTPGIAEVVLVTTTDPVDDAYAAIASQAGVGFYRGEPHHVAKRLVGAMAACQADAAVWSLGLHPFVNAQLAGVLLETLLADTLDLIQPPPNFPPPLSSLAFSRAGLERAVAELDAASAAGADVRGYAAKPFAFMLENPERFDTRVFRDLPQLYTPEELTAIRTMARHVYVEEAQNVVPDKLFAPVSYMQNRYRLATEILPPGSKVLDIACGNGFGSDLLARHCVEVVGADLNPETIEKNKVFWKDVPNVSFVHADAQNLPFEDGTFDAVISMETIEHVPDMARYTDEMRRVLKPGGYFICSTPQSMPPYNTIPYNPWHVREFTVDEFRTILGQTFRVKTIYGVLNSLIRKEEEEGSSMIAVCEVK